MLTFWGHHLSDWSSIFFLFLPFSFFPFSLLFFSSPLSYPIRLSQSSFLVFNFYVFESRMTNFTLKDELREEEVRQGHQQPQRWARPLRRRRRGPRCHRIELGRSSILRYHTCLFAPGFNGHGRGDDGGLWGQEDRLFDNPSERSPSSFYMLFISRSSYELNNHCFL